MSGRLGDAIPPISPKTANNLFFGRKSFKMEVETLMAKCGEGPTLALWDLLQALHETRTVQFTQIVLIEVEFATAVQPSIKEVHFARFDPPRGTVSENLITPPRREPVALPVRRQVLKARALRSGHAIAPSPAAAKVEAADHIRREHPRGFGGGRLDGAARGEIHTTHSGNVPVINPPIILIPDPDLMVCVVVSGEPGPVGAGPDAADAG